MPDKYIGLNIHQVLARIVRRSFAVHKTVPAALEWAQSGRSLLEEKVMRRTNMFISESQNFQTKPKMSSERFIMSREFNALLLSPT